MHVTISHWLFGNCPQVSKMAEVEVGVPGHELTSRDPPSRTKSQSDTLDDPSSQPTRPSMARLSSYTFGQEKKLFHGRNTKKQWMFAVKKTRELIDPWAEMRIDSLPEQAVTRHMYNPRTRKWKSDEIIVKMQTKVSGALNVIYKTMVSVFSVCHCWLREHNLSYESPITKLNMPLGSSYIDLSDSVLK